MGFSSTLTYIISYIIKADTKFELHYSNPDSDIGEEILTSHDIIIMSKKSSN